MVQVNDMVSLHMIRHHCVHSVALAVYCTYDLSLPFRIVLDLQLGILYIPLGASIQN